VSPLINLHLQYNQYWIPRGFNISVDTLTGGLNLIEYDPGMGKPEPINLTMTAPEVFNFIKQLETLMQILVGISDVNRGMVPPKYLNQGMH